MNPLHRTSWWVVVVATAVGLAVGYLSEVSLSAAGAPPLIPPYSLPVTLLVISGIVLSFAVSIRRSIAGSNHKRINPFVAVRVLAAAKAAILGGALFAGFALGILIYFALRTVPPQAPAWWAVLATLAASVITLAIGLIAEHFCRIPPSEDSEEHDVNPDAPTESTHLA